MSAAPSSCSVPRSTIAKKIRRDVAREVGVTCSVGIAPAKFVAKLASDGCKPDGLLHVPVSEVASFLEPLPVGRLWGVGRRRGTVGALGDPHRGRPGQDPGDDPRASPRRGSSEPPRCRWRRGIDDRPVVPYEQPKSIGHEETFDRDLDDEDESCASCWRFPDAWPLASARTDIARGRSR